MANLRAGRLADAERLAEACYKFGVEVGDADALGWYGAQLVAIRWLQGAVPSCCPCSTSSSTIRRWPLSNDAFLAGVAGCKRGPATPTKQARLWSGSEPAGSRRRANSSTWLVTMLAVIEAAHVLGDPTTAREAYDLLAPFAELPIMASLAIACFGSAHRPLGLAALTFGELDLAIDHFEAAVRADLRLGNRPCHAVSCSLLAAALHCAAAAATSSAPGTSGIGRRRRRSAWASPCPPSRARPLPTTT